MKAAAKHKVVTSGRLTRGVKVQLARRQATPSAGPPASPVPAYSLYSTDSEDQAAALHKGLDRCAALLDGILQADDEGLPKAAVGGAAKSSSSVGKTAAKELHRKTGRKNPQNQRGRGGGAHSGVRLHPPQRQPHTPLRSRLSPAAPPSPQPQTSVLLSVHQSSSRACRMPPPPHASCDGEGEEDVVPVRDINTDRLSHAHAGATATLSEPLEPGQMDGTPQDSSSRKEEAKSVERLLGELKALIAGRGSVAERLLSHLEQAVRSALTNVGAADIRAGEPAPLPPPPSEPEHSALYVRTLNQQLKEEEEAERQQNMERLCNSQATLQGELAAAQSQLRRLQDDLGGQQEALQDARQQLRRREEENAALTTDLEVARGRLVNAEREKSELASLAQQRLEEIEKLNGILQRPRRQPPAETPAERVAQYLLTLGKPGLTHTTRVCVAEREGNTPEQEEPISVRPGDASSHTEPAWSDWSMRSGSTFDTRDEAAFRDGLAALDASIASLQRTLQLDLRT